MDTGDSSDDADILERWDLSSTKCISNKEFTICRPIYTQYEFDENYRANYEENSFRKEIKRKVCKCKDKYCTTKELQNLVFGKFPFILTLWKYKWKNWLIEDFISGLIVGIMNIPQGMAYAQLAGLRPVYGLYVSIIPPLIYFFLGTSKHISIGSMAIASLMTGKFLEKSMADFPMSNDVLGFNATVNITIDDFQNIQLVMAKRAAGFTLLVGATQLIMGFLNMGLLTRYLSDPVISGFTVGASMHVFVSQIKYCFGTDVEINHGLFNIINTIIDVSVLVPYTNIPTFSLTIISILLLGITKEFINPFVVSKLKFPIPIELLIVIGGIGASRYWILHEMHQVIVVGEISKRLPFPMIPDMRNSFDYMADILITAIIAYTVSVSLAKIFSKKHNYKIYPNQEFLAYGVMNIISSFFLCFPSAASLSRSTVQESTGSRTQITAIVSSFLLILVLLFLGPLFEPLPNCILASIIIVSLKGMLMQFKELKELWIFSKWDFNIWMTTFIGTVLLDVEYGLVIGISLSISSVMLRTQNPNSYILGQINGTDIYRDISMYYQIKEIPGIKIFRYEGSLYYASCDHFRKSLYTKVSCDPREIHSLILKLEKKLKKIQKLVDENFLDVDILTKQVVIKKQLEFINKTKILYIIIDCSTWEFLDIVGIKTLNQVIEEYKSVNISVLFANPKTDVRRMFHKIILSGNIDDNRIYLTVHDAVTSCQFQQDRKIYNTS